MSVPPAPRRPAPPLTQPSQRGGVALAVVLAIVVGVVLVITRVRHRGGAGSLPHAGEAPCFVDQDCGGNGWACGPAGRCVQCPDGTGGGLRCP